VYGAMDLVVYPSRYISESGALLKAFSYGKAVVASNLPPVREKERLGCLTVFRDVDDLRRKISRILKDSEYRSKLEDNARRYVEHNSWKNVAEKHRSLYEHVMGQQSDVMKQ